MSVTRIVSTQLKRAISTRPIIMRNTATSISSSVYDPINSQSILAHSNTVHSQFEADIAAGQEAVRNPPNLCSILGDASAMPSQSDVDICTLHDITHCARPSKSMLARPDTTAWAIPRTTSLGRAKKPLYRPIGQSRILTVISKRTFVYYRLHCQCQRNQTVREAGQDLERCDMDSSEDSGEGSWDKFEFFMGIIGMICLVAFLKNPPSEYKHKSTNVAAVESEPSTPSVEKVNTPSRKDAEKECFFCGK
jgi:hypothetical protein